MKTLTEYEKQKIDRNEYLSIHYWLRSRYSDANNCESPTCSGKSSNYAYALIKGKSYERNRENYIQLCKSCHTRYDLTEEGRQRIKEAATKRKWSEERNIKISQKLMGIKRINLRKKVYAYKNGVLTKTYDSATEAAEDLGFKRDQISNYCLGKYRTVKDMKGYHLTYERI